MMPLISHILYATDLSENSAYAFRYALNSTMKHNAKVSLLHVLEPLPITASVLAETMLTQEQFQNFRNEKKNYTLDQIRRRLKIFCEKEMPDNPECQARIASIMVTEGFAADEIKEFGKYLEKRCLLCNLFSDYIGIKYRKGFKSYEKSVANILYCIINLFSSNMLILHTTND